MFAFDGSEERLKEVKEVLTQYFSQKLDKCLDQLWDSGVLDQDKLDELRTKHLRTDLQKWVELYSSTLLFTPYFHFNLIKSDPDDNMFVDCAIVANAKFILTEDKHFNILKQYPFPKVDIIGLDRFLESLG